MLRTLRGIIGTAIAWAVPWAVAGGSVLAVLGYVSFSNVAPPPVRIILDMFLNGGLVAGVIGAFAGVAFASTVALTERRSTFSDLKLSRMVAWGAIGGGAIALAFLGAASVANARILWPLWPLLGLSAGLGAASSASMLLLARRSREPTGPGALPAGAAAPPLVRTDRDPVAPGIRTRTQS